MAATSASAPSKAEAAPPKVPAYPGKAPASTPTDPPAVSWRPRLRDADELLDSTECARSGAVSHPLNDAGLAYARRRLTAASSGAAATESGRQTTATAPIPASGAGADADDSRDDPLGVRASYRQARVDASSGKTAEGTTDAVPSSAAKVQALTASSKLDALWPMIRHSMLRPPTGGRGAPVKISAELLRDAGELDAPKEEERNLDDARRRLEQMDRAERRRQGGVVALSQNDIVARLQQMHAQLRRAWASGQRVLSLKLAVQAAKLLCRPRGSPEVYPTMFVLATSVLDTFGRLVFARIREAADQANARMSRASGTEPQPLPDTFLASDVPAEAREICRNWLYKTACIREMLPRLYMEAALAECQRFLSDAADFAPMLLRLARTCRGLGSPLVADHARLYVARVGRRLLSGGVAGASAGGAAALARSLSNERRIAAASLLDSLRLFYQGVREEGYPADPDEEDTAQGVRLEPRLAASLSAPSWHYLSAVAAQESPASGSTEADGEGGAAAQKAIFERLLKAFNSGCKQAAALQALLWHWPGRLQASYLKPLATLVKQAKPGIRGASPAALYASLCRGLSQPRAEPPADKIRPLLTTAWSAAGKEDKAAAELIAARSKGGDGAKGGGAGGALPMHSDLGPGVDGEGPADAYISRCAGMMLLALQHGGSSEVQVVLKGAARRIQAELKKLAAATVVPAGGAASGAGTDAGKKKVAAGRLPDGLAQRVQSLLVMVATGGTDSRAAGSACAGSEGLGFKQDASSALAAGDSMVSVDELSSARKWSAGYNAGVTGWGGDDDAGAAGAGSVGGADLANLVTSPAFSLLLDAASAGGKGEGRQAVALALCKAFVASRRRECREAEEMLARRGARPWSIGGRAALPAADPVLADLALQQCRSIAGGLSAMSPESDRQGCGKLAADVVLAADFGRDVERQLTFLGTARRALHAFPQARAAVAHAAAATLRRALAMAQRRRGATGAGAAAHTKRSATFSRACAAFLHVTVPAESDPLARGQMLQHAAECSLACGCGPQADAMLRRAIAEVEGPAAESAVELQMRARVAAAGGGGASAGSSGSSAAQLQSLTVRTGKLLCGIAATTAVFPGHPADGPLHLVRACLDATEAFPFDEQGPWRCKAAAACLRACAALAQPRASRLVSVAGVSGTHDLWAGDPALEEEAVAVAYRCAEVLMRVEQAARAAGKEAADGPEGDWSLARRRAAVRTAEVLDALLYSSGLCTRPSAVAVHNLHDRMVYDCKSLVEKEPKGYLFLPSGGPSAGSGGGELDVAWAQAGGRKVALLEWGRQLTKQLVRRADAASKREQAAAASSDAGADGLMQESKGDSLSEMADGAAAAMDDAGLLRRVAGKARQRWMEAGLHKKRTSA